MDNAKYLQILGRLERLEGLEDRVIRLEQSLDVVDDDSDEGKVCLNAEAELRRLGHTPTDWIDCSSLTGPDARVRCCVCNGHSKVTVTENGVWMVRHDEKMAAACRGES